MAHQAAAEAGAGCRRVEVSPGDVQEAVQWQEQRFAQADNHGLFQFAQGGVVGVVWVLCGRPAVSSRPFHLRTVLRVTLYFFCRLTLGQAAGADFPADRRGAPKGINAAGLAVEGLDYGWSILMG
jgi:hypothetical protein